MTAQEQLHEETTEISHEEVLKYLQANPEFIADHPELLDVLSLPHATSTTSLVEHQVSVLQDKNRMLRKQLDEYRDLAAQNEQRLEKLFALSLDLFTLDSMEALKSAAESRLRSDFECDAVCIAYFSDQPESLFQTVSPADSQHWRDVFERDGAICGRIKTERLRGLFGDAVEDISSAVVAPLDHASDLGLLALGSRDENRFHPGLGTLFPSLLAQVLGQCMENLNAR